MLTYQDLLAVGNNEGMRRKFALRVIDEHKVSALYRTAVDADEYDRRQNTTIMRYRKFIYDQSGRAMPDNYSANYKLPSAFFPRFITQLNQYLLGNGITMDGEQKAKLGERFDTRLQQLGRSALAHGVAFGFWNLDHLEIFRVTEFAPLYDEETGALMAGVRFWQLSTDKPLRVTLYEPDGWTEYRKPPKREMESLGEKQNYKYTVAHSDIGGTTILNGENYAGFPIIPLYGNPQKQSELIGLREQIDCYDLIKSGFANDLDEAVSLYWIITNAGGMNAKDVSEFIHNLRTMRGATVDGDAGVNVSAHSTTIPHEARKVYLEQLKNDMYEDFQIVNVTSMSGGSKTATEINAAYEPMNNKTDQFEYCVLDFLYSLFDIVGIDAEPSFVRSRIVNRLEETNMVLAAADLLGTEMTLRKLPWLTPEEVEEILTMNANEEAYRMARKGTGDGGLEQPLDGGTAPGT